MHAGKGQLVLCYTLTMSLPNFFSLQDISRSEDTLSSFRDMHAQSPSPQLEQDIARLEKEIELYSQEKLCYEAQLLRVYQLLSPNLYVCGSVLVLFEI